VDRAAWIKEEAGKVEIESEKEIYYLDREREREK
jgi:hypothetical protein